MKKKIVVFSGAGVSKDSGISTFRDEDGLWAQHRIEDVCTPEALRHNREQVIKFYNMRRKELLQTEPNAGHYALVDLEQYYDVHVITQNIDDLHERAGSSMVTHLHGELRKLRSSVDEELIVPLEGWEQSLEARGEDGALLRPFVVFFGEDVPQYEKAISIVKQADILIIVGSSLAVYPAAYLVRYIRDNVPVWMVDPNPPAVSGVPCPIEHIEENSISGLPKLRDILIASPCAKR